MINTLNENLIKLGISFNSEDYKFLETNPDLHTPILIVLGGSYAYGTNIPTSDLDIRGVAMHSSRDILLNKGFEQIVNEETDTTIYSLEKIINLMSNCNPNTIEILGVKPDHILYSNEIGKKLIKNKDMFLSQRCVGPFMGYANQQLYRLQQKSLCKLTEEEFNSHIYKVMKSMTETLASQYSDCMNMINLFLDKEKGICIDLDIKALPIDRTEKLIELFTKTYRDYHRVSKRNEYALARNKIAKHAMHLLRLYMMCEDILLYGEINTYRDKEHDLLMAVRNEEFLEEDGKPNKEFFKMVDDYNKRIEEAKKKTILPPKPDFKRIDDFVAEANYSMIKGD